MRGRFAPSPTGYMHLGNAWTALLVWLQVRQAQGTLVLRIEDIDEQRSKPVFVQGLLEDLTWLGLTWDEGPDVGGPVGLYVQQQRYDLYEQALASLREQGLLYPCYCSRARLAAIGAPHEGEHIVYDGHCYHLSDAERANQTKRPSWRVHVPAETITFTDGVYGLQKAFLPTYCGDFVVRRADGLYAYQLAVSVDDGMMGITHILRGCDLLSSTAQQQWLIRFLGYPVPQYTHVPMLMDAEGHRLSKRQHGIEIRQLCEAGLTREAILSYLAYVGGLVPERRCYTLDELVQHAALGALRQQNICIHADVVNEIRSFQLK